MSAKQLIDHLMEKMEANRVPFRGGDTDVTVCEITSSEYLDSRDTPDVLDGANKRLILREETIDLSRLFLAGGRDNTSANSGQYNYFGYACKDGLVMVLAGCRFISVDEAIQHWADDERALQLVDRIYEWGKTFYAAEAMRKDHSDLDVDPAKSEVRIDLRPVNMLHPEVVRQFMGDVQYVMFQNWIAFGQPNPRPYRKPE